VKGADCVSEIVLILKVFVFRRINHASQYFENVFIYIWRWVFSEFHYIVCSLGQIPTVPVT
jgi:hypothetical protein